MGRITLTILAALTAFVLGQPAAWACTNFLVTRGASADRSTMITYSADSFRIYGELVHYPAGVHAKGAIRRIYDWDSGLYHRDIPEAPVTYNVVGNINEHQVAIGETTWGGRKELHGYEHGIDYGSLMFIALQRSRTARQAIQVMTSLANEYGYSSSGESFSIADAKEVWIMDMIGKGPEDKGVVWVARKVPEGYVSAHANHARIRQFPLNDRRNTLYSPDVISFAREKGYFKGKDNDFDFSATYAPPSYGKLRFCEARVWSFFNRIAPSKKLSTDYVKGKPGAKPMPLWIKPDKRLKPQDLMALMRDHYEGTEFDLSTGCAAGPFNLPYRSRPLTWEHKGVKYISERPTATQQTGFVFVAQMRSWLPDPIGGIFWLGMDDAASTVFVPMYCGITEVPKSYGVGVASFTEFSWDSAFWVFNFVGNYKYLRYRDMIEDIRVVQQGFEGRFLADIPRVDAAALALHKQSPPLAIDHLTRYSVTQGEAVVERWRKLGIELFMKYLDGNVRDHEGRATFPGYPESFRECIIQEKGEHLKYRALPGEEPGH
jgi:dipeptidase